MYLLAEIEAFLACLGFKGPLAGLQPLVQWDRPTAFRVVFEPGASPRSMIVKQSQIPKARRFRPMATAVESGSGLRQPLLLTGDGRRCVRSQVYGYSQERNMLAIEDLGQTSLHALEEISEIGTDEDLWQNCARALAQS